MIDTDSRDYQVIEHALSKLDECGVKLGSMYITDTVVQEAYQSLHNQTIGMQRIHEEYPAVKKAWDQYQATLKLVK